MINRAVIKPYKACIVSPVRKSSEKTLKESSKFYSIKYLGVTKGVIGILSKRTRIPQLSPMETCKDVPLSVINSSMTDKNSVPEKFFSRFGYVSSIKLPNAEKEISEDHQEDHFYESDSNNEFIIHNYARPRGLISIRRSSNRDDSFESTKPIAVQCQRTGVSG